MGINNNNALMESDNNFHLPNWVNEADFSNDDLADEMAGLQLNFQRVKIPTGGNLQFEIPSDDPEDPDYVKTIEGVILYNHAAGTYWPEGSEYDDDVAPLCSSSEGVLGVGNPGGACADCQLNAWGSGEGGKGKACKNMRMLYILRDGEFMPLQLTLPPTSIRPFTNFYNSVFASRRRGTCGSLVSIGLKRVDNGIHLYSVATFRKLYDFSGEQLAQIKAYANNFKEQVKEMLQQRTAEAISKPNNFGEDGPDYEEVFGSDGDGRFSISSPGTDIDGDREDLPA